uniref:Uncharacterized protein n=1 Tax=Glycine max TaxID=3847 RepID=C6SXV2_SOYBN|nr:unknown [Glycine max]
MIPINHQKKMRQTKLYRNGIVDNFNTCSRKSSNKPNNKSTINMRTTLIKFVIYYNHSNLTVLQKDVSHCVFQIQAFEACFSFAFWIFKTFFTIFCPSTKKARIILSLTALPDKTPPYARLTVLRFLGNLDLLYSAGLKCGIP